ncbi:MAG TPA: hypothetical protein VHD38_00100 [Candidatus Paceibacterota bacterium]|jgi:hypothetical protein|nr:hypothetical protein [Candidatus Paceibacterota bacterium]
MEEPRAESYSAIRNIGKAVLLLSAFVLVFFTESSKDNGANGTSIRGTSVAHADAPYAEGGYYAQGGYK